MKKRLFFSLLSIFSLYCFSWFFFGPTGSSNETIFVVPNNQEEFDVVQKLEEGAYIKKNGVFTLFKHIFLLRSEIEPGGYQINGKMWAWDILSKMNGKPDLVWVSFGNCLRKEQIG